MKFNKKSLLALLAAATMANTVDYVEAAKRKSPEGEQEETSPKAPRTDSQGMGVHSLFASALNRKPFFDDLILPYLEQQEADTIREQIGLAQETARARTLNNPGLAAIIASGLNADHMTDLISALNIAQMFTDPQEQRVFLNEIAARNPGLISRMFRAGSATNRIGIITAIMQTAGNNISKETLELSLQYAAASGRLEMVTHLLEHYGNFLSNAALGSTLRSAVGNGNLAIVAYLIEHVGDRISNAAFGWALRDASHNGNLAIVAYLIERADDRISNAAFGWALRDASHNGHVAILIYLIEHAGDRISDAVLIFTLRDAAEHDNLAVVTCLIEHAGDRISNDVDALNNAIAYAQDYVIATSLIEFAGDDISDYALGEVVLNAAPAGNKDLIIYLIEHFGEQIGSGYLGAALEEAINNGHEEIAELIAKTIANRKSQE